LELREEELTALINLIIGGIDAFDFSVSGLSSEDGALAYNVGDIGNVKLSGIGININAEDLAIVFTVTLPEDIPYAGFLLGGKQISIGFNPTMTVNNEGDIAIYANLSGMKVGGISAGWPGISHAINYAKNQFDFNEDEPLVSFNITEPLNNILDTGLGLEFAVSSGKISFLGPAPEERRPPDYGGLTQEQVAQDARDEIAAFTPGDTIELSEAELTALMADSVETALAEVPELGIDTDSLVVNVDEDGLSLSTTMTVPEGTDLPIPAGSEAEVDITTSVVIDDEGNASLVIDDISMGGLSAGDLGLDITDINNALEGSGVDLATALGLPPGSLTEADMGSGTLTLE
ncbi:hypothetical protein ACFLVP_00005, partial [Chloroflexota bacterium]